MKDNTIYIAAIIFIIIIIFYVSNKNKKAESASTENGDSGYTPVIPNAPDTSFQDDEAEIVAECNEACAPLKAVNPLAFMNCFNACKTQ